MDDTETSIHLPSLTLSRVCGSNNDPKASRLLIKVFTLGLV